LNDGGFSCCRRRGRVDDCCAASRSLTILANVLGGRRWSRPDPGRRPSEILGGTAVASLVLATGKPVGPPRRDPLLDRCDWLPVASGPLRSAAQRPGGCMCWLPVSSRCRHVDPWRSPASLAVTWHVVAAALSHWLLGRIGHCHGSLWQRLLDKRCLSAFLGVAVCSKVTPATPTPAATPIRSPPVRHAI
jgi:hypothetical protein